MYSLMIVDDKLDSIKAMQKLINWEEEGIEKVTLASNGKEALNKALEQMPDIIITDIRMPVMDGLKLTEEIKKLNNDTKIIIISGYDEFAYARKALQLGTEEYLLKPATIEDIKNSIRKAIESISKNRSSKKEELELKKCVQDSIDVLKEDYLNLIVRSKVKDIEAMKKKFQTLNIKLNAENFLCCIVHMDNYRRLTYDKSVEEIQIMIFTLHTMINKCMNNNNCEVFQCSEKEFCVIFNYDSKDNLKSFIEYIIDIMDKCRTSIKSVMNATATIGIGKTYTSASKIGKSFADALESIEYRIILGKDKTIYINDTVKMNLIDQLNTHELIKSIISSVRLGDETSVVKKIEDFEDNIRKQKSYDPIDIKGLMFDMLTMSNYVISDYEIENQGLNIGIKELKKSIDSYSFLEDLIENFKIYLCSLSNLVKTNRRGKERTDIEDAIKFIEENYYKDISLKDVAKQINLSPSYLSMLFKECKGENFINIITKYRMEEAKRLLSFNKYKVYEVASKVGYSDRRYFSDVFKKYFGVNPTEYYTNTSE